LILCKADPPQIYLCHERSFTLLRSLRLSCNCYKPLQTNLLSRSNVPKGESVWNSRSLDIFAIAWLSLGRSYCAVSLQLFLHQCCLSTQPMKHTALGIASVMGHPLAGVACMVNSKHRKASVTVGHMSHSPSFQAFTMLLFDI
jgi:hypothetical protein